jgi:hypothetical protein
MTMRPYARTGTALATLALAGLGLLGLAGCARDGATALGGEPAAGRQAGGVDVADAGTGLDAESQALTLLGFSAAELAPAAPDAANPAPANPAPGAANPSAAASPGASPNASRGSERRADRRPLRRELLRGRVLHAEAVVQGKDGVKVIVSQRGTITAIDDDSVTVRSADGFTQTWRFADGLRVLERRRTVQPTDLAAGAEIGLAGVKEGDTPSAGLIIRRP